MSRLTASKFAERVVAAHGVPDIVVNNAGIGHAGAFLDTSHKDWERVLDVNLWGVIHGCQAFGELMVAGGGRHITRTFTYSGVDEAEQQRRRASGTELYRRRNFPAKAVAKEIARAVRRDIPVVPVTVEAKAARLLSRISPAALRIAARISPV